MNCPSCAFITDYIFCDIIVTGGGSEILVTVNYGDNGPNDVFTPLSKIFVFLCYRQAHCQAQYALFWHAYNASMYSFKYYFKT